MKKETTIIDNPDLPVLIVDDSKQYADVLRRMLQGALGYKDITIVERTGDALTLIENDPDRFKMVFVDYNFPDGNTGGDLLVKLKELNLLEGKVAFLITSEPTEENMKQAKMAGALGVVAKPFNSQELRVKVDHARRSLYADSIEYF